MHVLELLKTLAPYVGALPGLVAIGWQILDRRKANRSKDVDLVKLASQVASDAIAGLRQRVADIETEFAEFRRKHDDMIAAKEARIAKLEAELEVAKGTARQLQAVVAVYDRLLTENHIQHPPPVDSFVRMQGELLLIEGGGPLP